MGWTALTVVMIAYLLLLTFGPATSTENGLRTMVLAQKLVTVLAGAILLTLCAIAAKTTSASN